MALLRSSVDEHGRDPGRPASMPTELSRLEARIDRRLEAMDDRIDGRLEAMDDRIDAVYERLGSDVPEAEPVPRPKWERRLQATATMLGALGAFLTPIIVVVLSTK